MPRRPSSTAHLIGCCGTASTGGATSLPTGTVTFLFTDIEGSTRLWEEHPQAMERALARHDALVREAIEANAGHIFKTGGDALCCAFGDAADAVAAALAAQRALCAEDWAALAEAWAEGAELRVRMALHTGPAQEREGDYFGASVNRVARLLACAHGQQTLLSRATYELVRDHAPEGASFQDLGEHSLRDLSHPEHVFQLCHADLPSDFPPLRSLQAFPHNLPLQLTSFIGREQEIQQVKELLAGTRLLTVTGVGGAGKTRLAVQVAAEVLEEYADGVWLTELAPLADPDLVPQTVASALGVREQPGQPIVETLSDRLRSKSCLLILDNCEHLLDASARLADELLRSCAEVEILASSREGLGIAGETTYQVLSLSVPEGVGQVTSDSVTPYESVRLFLDRAQSHQPSFEITDENAGGVAQICQRLDGIPLAIELAAARVRAMPVEQIAERLDDRFRLLTGGSRTALPRQQTLQALMDWSYDLLTEEEKTLLRRLSVFARGWTPEAAEAVCSGDGIDEREVLDLLASLVDKSVAAYEEQHGEARYRLLETVRQYARDRLLASGEAPALRHRHRDLFIALAEQTQRKRGGPQQAASFHRLEVEHDNLRAALDWCQETDDAEPGLRLASALEWFWTARGHLSEGRQRLGAALSRATDQRTEARARALHAAGWLAGVHGDPAAQRALAEEGLAIHRELGDERGVSGALAHLGQAARAQGQYSTARALFEETLAIRRRLGDKHGIAYALGNLGLVASQEGDYSAARPLIEESLAIHRELGSKRGLALSLTRLGLVASSQGHHAAAQVLLEESLAIQLDSGEGRMVAIALSDLGLVSWRRGDHSRARALLEESLAMQRKVQEKRMIALCLERLAGVSATEGRPTEGAQLFGAAEALREAMGAPLAPVEQDEYDRSVAAAREALGEEAFEAAWAEGRAMTMEEAIAYALGEADNR